MSPPRAPPAPEDTHEAEALDSLLADDPAGVYARMDSATRERYRRACRELAAWSRKPPAEVARESVRLSEELAPDDARARHVGAQLIAEHRPRLEARLGCRVPASRRAARLLRRHAQGAYVGGMVLLTGLLLAWVERLLAAHDVALLHRILLPLLLVVPLFDFVNEVTDTLLPLVVPGPATLPRLEPSQALCRETRTLVVTPLLVTNAEDVEVQLRRLEINYQGNRAPELYFALLTDFRDAPSKELPEDAELLERLRRGIQELNERHGALEEPRFLLLHRERRWNPVARCWMGWERKRGKLEEFNRLVLGATDTSYTGTPPAVVHTVRYALTLDADTHLLPGTAARLVATLHHPLNQARFDASGRRVVAGFSMLQPALETSPTRTLWLASGGWPVSIARNRGLLQGRPPVMLIQAMFGVGEFYGKGLYDVAAFARATENRLPENAILSHDKLEGMLTRVAFAHEIKLLEGLSTDFASMARVWHRWMRGDWQLLPWQFPWVRTRDGHFTRNPLSLVDRWRLMSDLRRGLNHPTALLLEAYGWLWLPASSAWAWTLGTLLWLCRHSLVYGVVAMLVGLLRQKSAEAALSHLSFSGRQVISSAYRRIAGIPLLAGIMLDAIGRALYRLAFDRSRILEWTTHAQSSRRARGRSSLALPEVWAAAVFTLGIAGAVAVFNPWALPWAAPMLFAWVPHMVFNRQIRAIQSVPAVVPEDLARLRSVARRAWGRYEQMDPTGRELPRGSLAADGTASESSPTDVALWLVAPLSAYHLGYLGLDTLTARLEASLDTLESLERHRGHLFQRYDAGRRQPVGPRRVCAEESGVLTSALLVIESGLRAARLSPVTARAPRQGLVDTLAVLLEEASTPGALRARLEGLLTELRGAVADGALSDADALAHVRRRQASLATERLAQLNALRSPREVVAVSEEWERLSRQLALLERSLQSAPAAELGTRLARVEARARALREAMDFELFYDGTAGLLHSGYDVDSRSLDTPHAGPSSSKALLAGFVAIARGTAPLQHWLALLAPGEQRRASGDSGSGLAEQLLPSLFLWFPPATLLGQAALAVVDADRALGVSPPQDSLLALRFRPERALENLKHAVATGAAGHRGIPDSRNQALALAAVANLTCDDILVQHFHQHWQTAWVEGLIYETKDGP